MSDNLRRRLRRVYELLETAYGFQGWWPLVSRAGQPGFDGEGYRLVRRDQADLSESDRFEIVAGAILTQNTAWQNVRRALAELRSRDLLSPRAVLALPSDELSATIRSSGYYNQKAKKLRLASEFFLQGGFLSGGRAPERETLLSLWGLGEETVDSILLYAFGVARVVVDAYTRRLLERLGLASERDSYPTMQHLFESALAPQSGLFGEYHALIVEHGKRHCRKQPQCGGCPLRRACRFVRYHSPES